MIIGQATPSVEELEQRIEELEERLELWCDYYFNGLPPDEVRDLYTDTLQALENDDG